MKNDDSQLTYDQVAAVTHAWLDLKADVGVSGERASLAKDSIEELEAAFPFLRETLGGPTVWPRG